MEIFNKASQSLNIRFLSKNFKKLKFKTKPKSQNNNSPIDLKIFYILILLQIIIGTLAFSSEFDSDLEPDTTDIEPIKCEILHCLECSEDNICSECDNGYYLDSNICKDCPTNCKTKQKNSCFCSECYEHYFLKDEKFCSECDSNCVTCENKSTQCTSCKDGLYVNEENICEKCVANCTLCSSKNICSECNDGYFYKDNTCPKCNLNCTKCSNNDKFCTECESNYFLYEDDHICYGCPNNCKQISSSDCSCISCWSGNELVKGKCRQCNIDNCASYKENSCACDNCNSGYYLNEAENRCDKCDETLCKECKEEPTKCTSCHENYFLENNHCWQCTECKEQYESSCQCKSCQTGYYLNNQNQCFSCNKTCKSCESNENQCYECLDGYVVEQFKCYKCHSNCKSCFGIPEGDTNQKCKDCFGELIFHENNCITSCPKGYYEENKKCVLCNQLCKTSGENCNDCTSCYDGYYLKESLYSCEKCDWICKTCSDASTTDNNNCLSCNLNSEYKYFVNAEGFPNNCVKECPEGTVLNNRDNITCVLPPKTPDTPSNSNNNQALIIAICIMAGFVLILFSSIILYNFIRKRRKLKVVNKADDKLIAQINKDLNLYQSFT